IASGRNPGGAPAGDPPAECSGGRVQCAETTASGKIDHAIMDHGRPVTGEPALGESPDFLTGGGVESCEFTPTVADDTSVTCGNRRRFRAASGCLPDSSPGFRVDCVVA